MNKRIELLAPSGSESKLKTAFHFGADAVYLGGSEFGLRAYADNFDADGLKRATEYAHKLHKKVYITANIFASNRDFAPLRDYFSYLSEIGADGVIISDAGVIDLALKTAPDLDVHLSTQANTTNAYAVRFWAEQGVKRVVLARELPISDIAEIKNIVGDACELEVFVHGAMCISYSGRCLLSSYLTSRDSNRGECVQACRWEYAVAEVGRRGNPPLTLSEDAHGSYILNSKDLNMLPYVDRLIKAGVSSFKIEGRMKSEYYVGSVVNAYRRAVDAYYADPENFALPRGLERELDKTNHRGYTTGFYFGDDDSVRYDTSKADCGYEFVAEVTGYDAEKGCIVVEQRNRFKKGDELEILSVGENFNKTVVADEIFDKDGNSVEDCKYVQQKLYIKSGLKLEKYDILRCRRGGKIDA